LTEIFILAAFWLSLAVIASILANHLRTSTALMEICVGIAAAAVVARFIGPDTLGADSEWLRFLAVLGAVILTFLAGAELDPAAIRPKWKEVIVVGVVGFLAPFLGCTAVAYYLLGWDPRASLLAGVVLSETSVAIVYSVMLETGLNRTGFGKGILGACFITDLGTVLALGLIFAPFTYKTLVFLAVSTAAIAALPFLTRALTRRYAYRTAAIRTKWVLLVLFGLGGLALWSGSEAVLPAYIAGMVLAGAAAQDPFWIRRLRTLTIGLLTPFYFLRAGSLVSLPALLSAPLIFLLLLGGKVASKVIGLHPVVRMFREERSERWYYKLMMSTGLTFGTIAALYGFSHGIITHEQYSFLVAAVIGSAVVSTMIANFAFLPRHLLPSRPVEANGPGAGVTAPNAAENGPDGLQDE
jgi:glutathione-regulated potassium-efflux system ancillary protein KefC